MASVTGGSLIAKRAGAVADHSWPPWYRQPGLGRGDPGPHSPQDPSIRVWLGFRGLSQGHYQIVVHGASAPRAGFRVLVFDVWSFRLHGPSASKPRASQQRSYTSDRKMIFLFHIPFFQGAGVAMRF